MSLVPKVGNYSDRKPAPNGMKTGCCYFDRILFHIIYIFSELTMNFLFNIIVFVNIRYVVTRFRATNPGYWLISSQIEFLGNHGMSLVLKVGNYSDMKPAPKGMNIGCGDFDWTVDEFDDYIGEEDLETENGEKS